MRMIPEHLPDPLPVWPDPLPEPHKLFSDTLRMAVWDWLEVYGDIDGCGGDGYATSHNRFLLVAEQAWLDMAKLWDEQHPEPDEPLDLLPPRRGFHLYRLWGDDGRLVYVGVSRCLRARLRSHRRRWDTQVWDHATWEAHASIAEMFAAERLAIRDEAPPLNIAGVE